MAKEMNLNESLLFDDEFQNWLKMSDKMYEDLAQQPVQPQQPGATNPPVQPGQPQQAQTTPQQPNHVKALAETWLKQLQATTKDPSTLNAFQAFVKTLKP